MDSTENNVENNVYACLELLYDYIEKNKITNTSVTTALGESNIDGEIWQIQLRLEKKDIYSKTEVVESFVYKSKLNINQ